MGEKDRHRDASPPDSHPSSCLCALVVKNSRSPQPPFSNTEYLIFHPLSAIPYPPSPNIEYPFTMLHELFTIPYSPFPFPFSPASPPWHPPRRDVERDLDRARAVDGDLIVARLWDVKPERAVGIYKRWDGIRSDGFVQGTKDLDIPDITCGRDIKCLPCGNAQQVLWRGRSFLYVGKDGEGCVARQEADAGWTGRRRIGSNWGNRDRDPAKTRSRQDQCIVTGQRDVVDPFSVL